MNNHQINNENFNKVKADCLVIGVFEDEQSNEVKQLDKLANGLISRLIKEKDISGKVGSSYTLHDINGINSSRLMLLGLGKFKDDKVDNIEEQHRKNYKKACEALGKKLKLADFEKIAVYLPEIFSAKYPQHSEWSYIHAIVNIERAMYSYPAKKKDAPKPLPNKTFMWFNNSNNGVNIGTAIASAMEKMLLVANHPANQCTPTDFAKYAETWVKDLAKKEKSPISIKVLGEKKIHKLGMNCFLSVAQGSVEEPKLVEIIYKGSQFVKKNTSKKVNKTIALVGKGMTFDSGGISLKPGAEMDHMKWDMCGAASVLATVLACAQIKLPIDIVVVTPLAENLPSGKAVKPSDVVTTMNGLTVENLNTDAEGRLILCDALTYTQKFHKPETIIDVATLTGACVVALGSLRSGLVSNNDELANEIINAGNCALDPTWRMPFDSDYLEGMKSNFADLANISGKGAGTITAAMFLSKFIEKGVRWGHLDIAGVAYNGAGAEKGATGRPLPLLMSYLLKVSNK